MKMSYQTVQIDKLQPDPDQPRQYIDQDAIEEMSVSIKNEGLINPIEVDEKFVIITGERRWRASKMAGLKEVPVKVIEKLPPKDRFIRQVQENIHQNTMSAWDTAIALDKIRKWVSSSAAELDRDEKHGGERYKKGVKELHELLGIPKSTITEILDILDVTGKLKSVVKNPSFQRTKIATIKEAPAKYQKELGELVADQIDLPRDTVRNVASALRRADKYGEDEKAKELLNENFEGLTTFEALDKINKIIPNEESRCKEPADAVKMMSEKIINLMEFLDEHPLESFDAFHKSLVTKDIIGLGIYLKNFMEGKDMKTTGVSKVHEQKLLS